MTWLLNDIDNYITRSRVVNGKLQESLLDQMCCTDKYIFKSFKISGALGKSDHLSLICTFNLTTDVSYITTDKVNWNSLSTDDMKNINSEINWNINFEEMDIEDMWDNLYEKMTIFEEKASKTTVKFDKKGNIISKPPWESASLKKLRSTKNKLWCEFGKFPSAKTFNIAYGAQENYEKAVQRNLVKYETKITSTMKS